MKSLSSKQIADYQSRFEKDPASHIALNAVTKSNAQDVALNRRAVVESDFNFSHEIKTSKITAQLQSGRCWLFAGLNTLRISALKKLNVDEFELSQSYCFFWDKMEKANYFLENVINTLDEPLDSRLMMWLLSAPLNDGGQWDMFANLIKKYGVVPKSIMPETFHSSSSPVMNMLATTKLRQCAMTLRDMHSKGKKTAELRKTKVDMMEEMYRLFTIFLGEPPTKFHWQWKDKKGKFHSDTKEITPLQFFKKYVDYDIDSVISIINCPTADKPFNEMYTVDYLGNILEGEMVRYLNVDMKTFKDVSVKMLKNNEPVWFGSDVGKMTWRDGGILHGELYQYDKLFGIDFDLSKGDRIGYGESRMNHAMVFTGVNIKNGKPNKWKVENSWGDKFGDKGFFVMDNKWFEEHMYQVVVPVKYLPVKYHKIIKRKPIHLKPWDPMGSLAVMY